MALLAALPEIARDLHAIRVHIEHVDLEVEGMHAAVERLDLSVQELRSDIGALGLEMTEVGAGLARLEPHVQHLSNVARPLHRVRSRLQGPGRIEAAPDTVAPDVVAPDASDAEVPVAPDTSLERD